MPQLANVKCDMFMNGGGSGWTETHWHTSAFTPGTLLTGPWVAAAIALCAARANVLNGLGATLVACRLSAGNVYRDSLVMKPGQGGVGPPPTIVSKSGGSQYVGGLVDSLTNVITPQVSIPLLMTAGNGQYRATTYLTTCDAQYYTGGTAGGPTSAGLAQCAVYVNALLNGGNPNATPGSGPWGMPVRVVGGGTPQGITGATFTAPAGNNPYWTMTLVLAGNTTPTLGLGVLVRVSGMVVRSMQKRIRFNGTYTVAGYTAPGTIVINMPKLLVAPIAAVGGQVSVIAYQVLPYQGGTVGSPTHHKRGRPTFSPAGRRQAVA